MRRAILIPFLFVTLSGAGAAAIRAETPSGQRQDRLETEPPAEPAERSVGSDLRKVMWRIPSVYKAQLFTREGLRIFLYGAPFLGASFIEERAVSDWCREHRIGEDTVVNEGLDLLGDALYPALPLPIYAVGRLIDDDRLADLAVDLATLTIASFPELVLLRYAGDRPRPNGERDFFFGLDSCSSFPSGHAVASAGLARLAHDAYGPWVGVPLYLVAAAVGYQRLGAGEHYLADVVGGFLLGFSLADAIIRERRREREESPLWARLGLRPLAGGRYRALGVQVSLGF